MDDGRRFGESSRMRSKEDSDEEEMQHADKLTSKILLQVEQFKASLAAPKGGLHYDKIRQQFMSPEGYLGPIDADIQMLRNFDTDNEFFHVTCHLDENLKSKIHKGEFVKLERLLPKEKSALGHTMSNDHPNRLELINEGGHQYVAPYRQVSNRINSVKKWDQAFRVYAAVYCEANPNRSSEIWQYMHVIHSAAGSHPWEDVAYYDFTFRHLMATKPWRSWGKAYLQGCNLALNNSTTSNFQKVGLTGNHSQQQAARDWKEDCCWKYNKNRCKNTASSCRYDHRCTYCGVWNHSFVNCRKRSARKDQATRGHSATGNSGNTSAGVNFNNNNSNNNDKRGRKK